MTPRYFVTIDLHELEGRIDCDQPQGEGARCYISPPITPRELTALIEMARAFLRIKHIIRTNDGNIQIIDSKTQEEPSD